MVSLVRLNFPGRPLLVSAGIVWRVVALCWVSLAMNGYTTTIGIDRFLVLNPTNAAQAYERYNGNVMVYDGFYLSALLNGTNGAELTTDYLLDWGGGIGVGGTGSIGFTRSINRNSTMSEAVELYVSPDAVRGAYAGLTGVSVGGAASVIVISGFVSNPMASTANGSVAFASNAVTWTQATAGGSIVFSNASAVPLGSVLRFSNGSTSGGDYQFGLLGFSYVTTPMPVPGEAHIRTLDATNVEVSWQGSVGEGYRLQRSGSLVPQEWTNVSNRLKGTGDTLSVTSNMASARSFYRVVPDDTGMILGANVNGAGTALTIPLLEQSRSEWMRAFFPIKSFLDGTRNLNNDAHLDAVRKAVFSGRKLVLCLKLNFDDATWRVPAPGTAYETQSFQWVDGLLAKLDGRVSVLETVNETFEDTYATDLLPDTNGTIPMVLYQQRLVAHVHSMGYKTPEGAPLPLYGGGFTRLYGSVMRARPFVPALLNWIQSDNRVTGPNFHIHAEFLTQFQDSFDFLRATIPSKPAIVTEFSLVAKYKANLEKPLNTWASGTSFAALYGRNASMLVREYVNFGFTNGVSEAEYNDFLVAMPWYDTGFLGKASKVMQDNGTVIATFAFQQSSSGGSVLQVGDSPWILNPIFVNRTATNSLPTAPVNLQFFQDYMSW